jgi:hypothetical protein
MEFKTKGGVIDFKKGEKGAESRKKYVYFEFLSLNPKFIHDTKPLLFVFENKFLA